MRNVDYAILDRVDAARRTSDRAYRCPVTEGLKARFSEWRKEPSWTKRANELVGDRVRGEVLLSGEEEVLYADVISGEIE